MLSQQHLKGLGCAETRGPDSDVGGPAVGRPSTEAEGRLTSYGSTEITRPRSAEARGPDLDAWMSVPTSPLATLPSFSVLWSHAGLNRGPYGYWPYALTS